MPVSDTTAIDLVRALSLSLPSPNTPACLQPAPPLSAMPFQDHTLRLWGCLGEVSLCHDMTCLGEVSL